jgi:pimeloyl-ACP methyl ester carboxylesterase
MFQRSEEGEVRKRLFAMIIIASLISACGGSEQATNTPDPTRVSGVTHTSETSVPPAETPAPAATLVPPTSTARPSDTALPPSATAIQPTADMPTSTEALEPLGSLLSLISQGRLFASLEELTSIQAYSGWRNSATEGEAEALTYVANTLGNLAYLQNLGMALERQSFRVFLATELWETRLYVTTRGQETEVPADALRGHRHDVAQALRFDSDGALNDSERNPIAVEGDVVLIRSASEIDVLEESDVQGRIVFLDSAVIRIDPAYRHSSSQEIAQVIAELVEKGAAGLVLVTQYANVPEGSQGKFVGDGIALEGVATEAVIPTLYTRLEDLGPVGIFSWEDLAQIETARLIWDTDVFSPGTSGNLIARIPGADSAQAIILGAHIDSANSPGAIDNGINSVALLEVAQILNEAQLQPAIDLYLVWFGSEEIGLYGSQHFVNTHQELLDRTVAAFLMDSIIVSTPGTLLVLDGWSHSRFGDGQLTFPRFLEEKADAQNIGIDKVEDYQGIGSDNGVFNGFVPTAGFAFSSTKGDCAHSPYDTAETVQGLGNLLEEVASLVLIAAWETSQEQPELRVTPTPSHRAVIVASHTEVVHMTPATLVEMSRALAWEGFDLDVIPFGQAVTGADLDNAELVVVLPVIDYPGPGGDLELYDEAWTEQETEALVTYVEQGGLLVLTNSAHRIYLFGLPLDENEDWHDVNILSEVFGVVFENGPLSSSRAQTQEKHPLTEEQVGLALIQDNGVPFTMQSGETLAQVNGRPAVGLVEYGEAGGQVLVLADLGILGFAGPGPSEGDNLGFLRNLARYARTPVFQPTYEPVFELAECFTPDLRQSLPEDGYDLDCGYLIVPEDRSQVAGKQVELPVVIFHTDNPKPKPDPVIYLAGGGGFNMMPLLPFYMQLFGDAILRNRDLIVYNQRGAPLSEPALPCPGYGQLLYDLARDSNLSQEEQITRKIAFLADCHDDLTEMGIDLKMYNSIANAADAKDLRIALGYEQANYYGTSYGTTLGLALLRDHPQGVRSIILDSVQPPQVAPNSERAPNAYRAFSKLFAACAADETCRQTYPDLEATFYRVIDELNANPAATTAPGWQVNYGGGIFSEAISSMLVTGQAYSAPRAIYRAAAGDLRDIEPHIPDILNAVSPSELDIISAGVFYSLACREEVPFDSYEHALALAADLPPAIADHYLSHFAFWQFRLCESWAIEPDDPVVNRVVISDVPALVFAGQFDPITPSEWGKLAAETLNNSFFYEFPGLGHGVMDSDRCALEIGLQFLNEPTAEPDASCMDNLSGLDFE